MALSRGEGVLFFGTLGAMLNCAVDSGILSNAHIVGNPVEIPHIHLGMEQMAEQNLTKVLFFALVLMVPFLGNSSKKK